MSEPSHGSGLRRLWRRTRAKLVQASVLPPWSRDRRARRQALLQQELERLLLPLAGRPALGLAVLEGALALVMADGRFHDEEWQLFQRGMALLALQDPQRRSLSLHGAVDLEPVCNVFSALDDPAQCQAIAAFYRLLCAADGETGAAEQRPLARLLHALRCEPPAGGSHDL